MPTFAQNMQPAYGNEPSDDLSKYIAKLLMLDMLYVTNGTKESIQSGTRPINQYAISPYAAPKCELIGDITIKQECSPPPSFLLLSSSTTQPMSNDLKSIKPSICTMCTFSINEPITAFVEGKPYHVNCVRCSSCEVAMGFDETCYVRDGQILCRNDYAKKFRKKCGKCDVPITRDDIVMKAREAVFHLSCFTCYICGIALNKGDLFTMSAQKHIFCHAHYEVVCNTVLREEAPPMDVPPRENSEEPEENDEDNGSAQNRSKRMRTSFKHHQLRTMKQYFNLNHNPDAKDLKQLAQKTGLTKRVLQVWFQNARAKYRRSMQHRDGGNMSPGLPQPLSVIDNTSQISSSSNQSAEFNSSIATPPDQQQQDYYEPTTLVSL